MQNSHYLPLLLWGNGPYSVFIIQDEVVALEKSNNVYNSPLRVFSFVSQLARDKMTANIIPKKILSKILHDDLFIAPNQPCLSGFYHTERFRNRCIAANMKIEKKTDKRVVQLVDFALLESNKTQDVFINKLNKEVSLIAKEAFILFGNLCFEATGYMKIPKSFISHYPYKVLDYQPPSLIEVKKKEASLSYTALSFSLDYFEFLSQNIAKKALDIELILRLNGSMTIPCLALSNEEVREFLVKKLRSSFDNFEQITIAEKICISLLLINSKFLIELIPEIEKMYKRNRKRIENFLISQTKYFPAEYTGTRKTQMKVFGKYGV